MAPNEFRAWLDGYMLASGDKAPTKAQWKQIREKLEEVSEVQYGFRYWNQPYWTYTTIGNDFTGTTTIDPSFVNTDSTTITLEATNGSH